MDFPFARLNELTPNVVAAVIGAVVTLLAALINLRIAWRREIVSRLEGARGNGKARKGLLPAIVFMVAAAAVGGYALALYLMQSRESESALLRHELRQRADQIQSSAERIENARTLERYSALADARLAEERRRGAEGVAAAARLAPCWPASASRAGDGRPDPPAAPVPVAAGDAGAGAGAEAACRPESAARIAVCAVLPARASALELAVAAAFAAPDAPPAYAAVAVGADLGTARIAAAPFERSYGDGKLLCLDAWSWDTQRALDVRLIVRYLLADVVQPVADAQQRAAGS